MEYSEKESKRFGKRIFRYSTDEFKSSDLKNKLIGNDVDVLILRIPSSNINDHFKLKNTGFPYLHADTLVHYQVSLRRHDINDTRNNIELVAITDGNRDELKKLIPIIFDGYKNHYYSNPIFEPDKIKEGYIEWADSYVDSDNKISWLVKIDGQIAGFATCSFDEESKECEGVLYGVLPDFSGRGVYSDIIRMTQSYFKDNGYLNMWVSTQIQNYAVQKVWLREGYFLKKSYETYHINSLLDSSITEVKSFSFNISISDLDEFAKFSGDKNKLHFSDSYAQKVGFSGRISHGMIIQSYLSKYFGMDYPGEGTIFMNNQNVFLAPIYPNNEYKVVINTLSINKNGVIDVLAKVIDVDEKTCLLSYNTLMNKNLVL
jgi:acyl dehydratase/GNAT superfamily N-acetyltransferase